mmetsp:Transcript_8638/g.13338  ORF Transcript_8638/g.13338 Transcript_8638/m.13338 type:complete len:196 (+) Transcript_8638:59-646(+)|eukprot:CAMPEP_0202692250 /NCGR_PEP_ID=MMETSP1385-20130828/6673_1 /ASSEMBLY_ACC=CAM_ASM_000861 /TAXON_ID=933848 /ORGANISM="Elphidium margaritaceum" /LENGTH=195 /DNA_ID=CAMNT_0049347743 /DNA_START=38 /DNA_END=625 /DNA_ORIENTATION=-
MAQTEYKITVLGAGGVGKSALTIRLITGTYESNYDPTIEDSYRKQVQIDNKPALLDILDTAGQEEYAALQDQWIREGDGFLIVYAINARESFDEAEVIRSKIIRILDSDQDNPDVPIVLAGNKCDLENERTVLLSELEQRKTEWKCGAFETSAKEKKNIDECFYQVVREIRKRQGGNDAPIGKKTQKKGGFCTVL